MSRSLHGTIGAVLLSCVALSIAAQTTPPPPATCLQGRGYTTG
jgi:hypothetical protein